MYTAGEAGIQCWDKARQDDVQYFIYTVHDIKNLCVYGIGLEKRTVESLQSSLKNIHRTREGLVSVKDSES